MMGGCCKAYRRAFNVFCNWSQGVRHRLRSVRVYDQNPGVEHLDD